MNETKKELKRQLFELRLAQAFYIAEHKEDSEEIVKDIKVLKKKYARVLLNEKMGGKENDKH